MTERTSQRERVMLNLEYARLMEEERRRQIAARMRIERALHPDDPTTDGHEPTMRRQGRGISSARSATTPAR